MIVIHEANYRSPDVLAEYFNYDEREGLTQTKDLEGWRLVYSYPGKPTKFRIYRVDTTGLSAEIDLRTLLSAASRRSRDPSPRESGAAVSLRQRYTALEAAQARVDRLSARWADLEAKQA
jgi:hypothetical protein